MGTALTIITGSIKGDASKRDAQMKYMDNGNAVTKFSLPVDLGWGDKKETVWVTCTVFGNKGNNAKPEFAAKNVKVGAVVEVVTDFVKAREYQGKLYYECVVNDLRMIEWPPKDENEPAQQAAPAKGLLDDTDDIPF